MSSSAWLFGRVLLCFRSMAKAAIECICSSRMDRCACGLREQVCAREYLFGWHAVGWYAVAYFVCNFRNVVAQPTDPTSQAGGR
ncbi:uncharacterized protein SPSK_10175 [Sporothrix schenckii 1099-18]|uniref:Secreted protein n=1 Tax=Sporothrix schenckii 1099-18 TaxID=1397361 RepID=A0A0F2M4I0_SPOSC|nr:uncharacterized protein SPSK_10175 [Sporothrix schenckii 1099-18]KJR84618.1 hypothetical protein SPSK_10175 [Sporothrix schenckii 1099-18]